MTEQSPLTDPQLRALITAHHTILLTVAAGIVGPSEAEEVTQTAWLKAYRGWATFNGASSVRTWLTRIVINESKMQLRSRRRETLFADLPGQQLPEPLAERFNADGHWRQPLSRWSADSPDQLLMRDQLAGCLHRLLARMPAGQRAVLAMRDNAELDFEEICNNLAISASNARVLLHRARAQVVALVDHYEETGEC
jgi:RNA polymerase sigma-70 factor (ECF subfamily)